MRKFIVSDLHGNGEAYDAIMAYLDNISKKEDVSLYINGDLIDRGFDSFKMLIDVYNRCNGIGNVKIHYLAGNHEWLMYQSLIEIINDKGVNALYNWEDNGGIFVISMLEEITKREVNMLKDFLGNLKIYHKFPEKVNGKQVCLVHAQMPSIAPDKCTMKLSDQKNTDNNNCVHDPVFKAIWYRHKKGLPFLNYHPELLTIIGHSPVLKYPGIDILENGNIINIDGACANYAVGDFARDHVPLVEVKNGYLNFLIFNHKNEIIDGYVYDGSVKKMNEDNLNNNRKLLGKIKINDNTELIKDFYGLNSGNKVNR